MNFLAAFLSIIVACLSMGPVARHNFVGAFYRASDSPPYGVFASSSPNVAPNPYPTPGAVYTGANGYCDHVAANGYSLATGYVTDATKLSDMVNLGVKFSRFSVSSFFTDFSHTLGTYNWAPTDSAECSSYIKNGVAPIVGIENGPVQYDSTPGTFSPVTSNFYQSASDFATYCGAVATHEHSVFPSVHKYSIPGNEVDDTGGTTEFTGGNSQIASYTKACYQAIKAVDPQSFIYGFELNMDGSINVPAFITSELSYGCGPGTCYDGLSLHAALAYPLVSPSIPCFPATGGAYGMQCITNVINASGNSNLHVYIGEFVYTVPGSVPDEATKATAVVAAYNELSQNQLIDGVSYANVDECALYPSGYFSGGCLINTSNQQLPAYGALQSMALQYFQ